MMMKKKTREQEEGDNARCTTGRPPSRLPLRED